jgi:serine phosphatase RsbU (regulator of sigma subunit)
MTSDARRFARRTLGVHLLLLLVVLGFVALAARKIFLAARTEVIAQAQQRQQTLAQGTARGIENYYASILNDMDLLRQADKNRAPKKTTLSMQLVAEEALDLLSSAAGNVDKDGSEFLGNLLSRQLEGRVSLLFSCSRSIPAGRGKFAVHRLGYSVDRPADPDVVLKTSEAWIRSLSGPSIGPFQQWGDVSGNLIGVPVGSDRVLVAVVPIGPVQKDFLRPLDGDPSSRAWLVDQQWTSMAASRSDLVGIDIKTIGEPQLNALARRSMGGKSGGCELVEHGFSVGQVQFAPSMLAAEPVTIGDRQWEVLVATSLESVDGSVERLFQRSLLWGALVVVVIAAILASTAAGLIRGRMRVERLRHTLLAKEVAQARQIQLAWLPAKGPKSGMIDVAAINRPARHVSGDFYNWFELPGGKLAVAIGDVTGHGIPAAFLMATAQLITRNTLERLHDPGQCLEEVNRQLCVQTFHGQFVTMQVAVLDPDGRRMRIATAGHPAPLLINGGSVSALPMEPQLMLGVEPEETYQTEIYDLPDGAAVLLYTDGVIECQAADVGRTEGDRFGSARLLAGSCGAFESARARLERIVAVVDAFRHPRELDDDLTVVAIQVRTHVTDEGYSADRREAEAMIST